MATNREGALAAVAAAFGLSSAPDDFVTNKMVKATIEKKKLNDGSKLSSLVIKIKKEDNTEKGEVVNFAGSLTSNLFGSENEIECIINKKDFYRIEPIITTSNPSINTTSGSVDSNGLTAGDFKADNNAVVRSFESTNGKGLAGFITSLQLEYENSGWGTTVRTYDDEKDLNFKDKLRAPKKVKISINFAPIHDLPLGLNHQGRIIAPSHPVGSFNSSMLDKFLF
jgi:hypothetical protein